ncbi:MAG: mandelate racemase/muconate lactonizing enzyme family protein [Anaerolineales bacterium]
MQITDIETILLRNPMGATYADAQHTFGTGTEELYVRIHTDEGITGHATVGFGVGLHGARAVREIIARQCVPLLIGQDPFQPRACRERLAAELEYAGIEGLAHFAMTGLDTALWDIMARALGVPGWKLFGACRDRLPTYAMVGWYYPEDDGTHLDGLQKAIEGALADGYRGVKIKVGRGPLEEDVRRIELVRSLIGDGPLMVDANQVLSRNEALRRGRVYEQLGVTWFEEPLRPHDKAGYAWLCEQLDLPVAAGENEYGKYHVCELLTARGCDILQPDRRRTAGPSEWLEIAGLAAAMHVPIASHGGDLATVHLLMATPTAEWCETGGVPKGPGATVEQPRIEDGWVYAPEAPGLGLELRAEVIAQRAVR